jgi:rhamnosyltransferase
MRTLVVMAHYDAMGQVADHVLHQLDRWNEVADRVIVVSTAELTDPVAVEQLEKRAELVRRPNYGYDFFSYKTGLDAAGDLTRYDLVIICNDSYVGPLVPWSTVLRRMADRPLDFWGLTYSARRGLHVQSFFVAFTPWVVRSRTFQQFWRSMTPVSDRFEVIKRYELGMSATLRGAGFSDGGYFEETGADRRLARLRHFYWAANTVRRLPRPRREAWLKLPAEAWNPAACLADKALEDARLPVVKIDTLRYDPYGLGSERLLTMCEQRYPDAFAGVRDYLHRTAELYPPRTGENDGPKVPPLPVRRTIGYAR